MGPERELGDDAEVAAAAADRPEEVRVLVGARRHRASVCEHHLRGKQVVDRQPVPPREVAVPAAERQPADAGRGDDPGRHGKIVRLRRCVDLAPDAATTDPYGAGLRIDRDRLHRREVDHDPVVDAAEAAPVVASAVHRERLIVLAREADRRRDVARVRAERKHRRTAVDHGVEERSRLVVARVVRPDQPVTERRQVGARAVECRNCRAHVQSSVSQGRQRA
jgi:hypothetical protein